MANDSPRPRRAECANLSEYVFNLESDVRTVAHERSLRLTVSKPGRQSTRHRTPLDEQAIAATDGPAAAPSATGARTFYAFGISRVNDS